MTVIDSQEKYLQKKNYVALRAWACLTDITYPESWAVICQFQKFSRLQVFIHLSNGII